MESIMPILVVIYFLATIVSAIIKKAKTPPRQPRPIPPHLEELFDLPDARSKQAPNERLDIPMEEPQVEPVFEYRVDEVQADEISAPPSADDRSLEKDRTFLDDRRLLDEGRISHERPYLDDRPLEDRAFIGDRPPIEEEPSRAGAPPRPRAPRGRKVGAQATRPVEQVRGLLTPDSLAQAVLLKEILGPPRAFNPYRPPVIGPRER